MGIQPGETLTLRDLVYGLMLVSGNDAGEAIAKHVAGSVDGFVALMNKKAQEIGMTSTHYSNPRRAERRSLYNRARHGKAHGLRAEKPGFRQDCGYQDLHRAQQQRPPTRGNRTAGL